MQSKVRFMFLSFESYIGWKENRLTSSSSLIAEIPQTYSWFQLRLERESILTNDYQNVQNDEKYFFIY